MVKRNVVVGLTWLRSKPEVVSEFHLPDERDKNTFLPAYCDD